MPTPTFYKLPREKREAILAAARREFSRVTFSEASINRIVADADISRGSFYVYFEDKKDLLAHLLSEYSMRPVDIMTHALEESGGDIFVMSVALFDALVAYGKEDQQDRQLFAKLFMSMHASRMHGESDIDVRDVLLPRFRWMNSAHMQEEMKSLINTEHLKTKTPEEIEDLFSILFLIIKHAVADTLFHRKDTEEARAHFLNMIRLIQYGAVKQGEPGV